MSPTPSQSRITQSHGQTLYGPACLTDGIRIKAVRNIHTAAELNDIKGKSGLVVIDFSAVWCGPCRFMGPTFERCSNDYKDATFATVDIDELSDADEVRSIRSVPTFRFYRNGNKVSEFSGASEGQLRKTIEANL